MVVRILPLSRLVIRLRLLFRRLTARLRRRRLLHPLAFRRARWIARIHLLFWVPAPRAQRTRVSRTTLSTRAAIRSTPLLLQSGPPADDLDSGGSDPRASRPTAAVESDDDSFDPEDAAGSPAHDLDSGGPEAAASSATAPVESEDGSVDSLDVTGPAVHAPDSRGSDPVEASTDPDADPVPVSSRSVRERSNRIVSSVAYDAKMLTARVDLVDFSALDRDEIPAWVESLEEARRALGGFIRRLRQEVGNGSA